MRSRTARAVSGEAPTACQRPSFSASVAMVTVTLVTFSPTASTRTVTRSAIRSMPFSAGRGARSARAVSMRPSAARSTP